METSPNHKRQHKEQLYTLFARIAEAMASPRRLELLDLLVQAPRTVEELAQEAHLSIANASQHLQRLKQARLVTDRREGTYIRYSLADPAIAQLWLVLRGVAEKQLVEVEYALDAYRNRQDEFEKISMEELQRRLQNGDVVLLDVRPNAEYQAGHLPGAISIPFDEIEAHLNELPADKTVVAYCRGPYCVYADEALATLAQNGRNGWRLEEGVLEWQQAGFSLA